MDQMKLNLDVLRSEILNYLETRGLAVFYSFPRSGDASSNAVYWNTQDHPDYQDFVDSALALDIRLVAVHSREFSEDMLDEALDRLTQTSLTRQDRRVIESDLRDLRMYEGFTCQIELSFDHQNRTYIYDLRTDWFEEFNELLDRIDDAYQPVEMPRPMGGYYSHN